MDCACNEVIAITQVDKMCIALYVQFFFQYSTLIEFGIVVPEDFGCSGLKQQKKKE